MQDLQRAAQIPAVMEALQQVQQDVQELAETHQQLQDWRETLESNADLSRTKLQHVDQHVQQLHIQLANQSADLTGLAESVLGCLSAARVSAAQAACVQPSSSYLSSLLGPAAAVPDLSSNSSQQQWMAWVSTAWGLLWSRSYQHWLFNFLQHQHNNISCGQV